MRSQILLLLLVFASAAVFAEDLLNVTNSTTTTVDSPFNADSRMCVFIREWILKAVFMVILLVFLLGIATFSGAAFPQWREKGGMMILGSVGAVILYLIGLPALKFLMGFTVCGL